MAILAIILAFIFFVVPVAIIALIVSAIVKRKKESNDDFENVIRNIYCYIILIIALFSIVAGTITVFRVGLDILLPEESVYNNAQLEKNENIVEVLSTLSIVLTCIPIFLYHNKITKMLKSKKIVDEEKEEI